MGVCMSESIEDLAKRVLSERQYLSDAVSHDLCLLAQAVLDLRSVLSIYADEAHWRCTGVMCTGGLCHTTRSL